jgi:hypothetical protein
MNKFDMGKVVQYLILGTLGICLLVSCISSYVGYIKNQDERRGKNCDPSYPTVCIPPPPPDLDCRDIPFRHFRVEKPDPHGFDGDGDHIGCE